MTIALVVIATILGLIATVSAVGKLTKRPDVIETMTNVGVPEHLIPALAGLELLGALGLIVGIWSKPIGVAAATGLTWYFLGAVASHVRAKDQVKDLVPALVLSLIAITTLIFEVAR